MLTAARATGKRVVSYFEALGEVAEEYKVIAVSGTHGKTTTTAMIAEVLLAAGMSPTVLVGSLMKGSGSNFIPGESDILVVEACEYKRHFTHFSPEIFVITNIEADHLDYYKDLEDVQSAFREVAEKSKNVVCDVMNGVVHTTVQSLPGAISNYAAYVDEVKPGVPGEHNKKNAAAAFAVASLLGVEEEVIHKALVEYKGTWRRLEKKGYTAEGAEVYDDYAHHPTEIEASLQALREEHPEKPITVVFEAHMFSRTKALLQDFAEAFGVAKRVVVAPIYPAREPDDGTMSAAILAEHIGSNHDNVVACELLARSSSKGSRTSREWGVGIHERRGDIQGNSIGCC